MVILKKGDCEQCRRNYRYSLWHSGFGDNSYSYCDLCGMLATLSFTNKFVANFPSNSPRYQEMEPAWEPLLRPCECGGRFRVGSMPRCPSCRMELSPIYAARHLEQNARGAVRGWHWQRNWHGVYCIAIEDPKEPGTLRQVIDPIMMPEVAKARSRWGMLFSFSR